VVALSFKKHWPAVRDALAKLLESLR